VAVLSASGPASVILGPVDALKLRSSMTLFARAAPEDPAFEGVLERFYDGMPDPLTDELLRNAAAGAT
jgi:uncharacterized protein (DUF1810 family)